MILDGMDFSLALLFISDTFTIIEKNKSFLRNELRINQNI